MNKKGFTLMELLIVIVIVAVVSVGATVSFSNIDDETAEKELANIYKDIQRAASLYLDLHDSALDQFISDGRVTVKISSLQDENYVEKELVDPITGEDIDTSASVVLYVKKEGTESKYVGSCIVKFTASGATCIADSEGHTNCTYDDSKPECVSN